MTTYTISTDSETMITKADSLAAALAEFGCPAHVRDAASFERWLVRAEGYGYIEADEIRIASVQPRPQ